MYKKIICIALLSAMPVYGIRLGPHLLANSPSHYLIDLETVLIDQELTQQIGYELFLRNYIDQISLYDQIAGRFDEPPLAPEYGYAPAEGTWIWIANALESEMGTWCWILKTTPTYLALFLPYSESL